MNKDKRIFFILLVALFVTLTYFHALVKEISADAHGGDFSQYWLYETLLKEGYNIWNWNKQVQERAIEIWKEHNVTLFSESPLHSLGAFLFILPFTFIPLRLAAFNWLVFGQLCLFTSIWLILKVCRDKPSLEDLLMVLFLFFAFWPIREQLHSGQPSFFILLFLTLSLFLAKKRQMLLAGLLLSLGIQFREYLALILLFFLWKKNWRLLAGVILGFLLLKGAAIFVFGLSKELSYWKYMVLMYGRGGEQFDMIKLSFPAVIYRTGKDLLGTQICFVLYLLGITLFIGKAFFWIRKKEVDLLLGFSLFLVLAFLVSPHVHEQHLVALYPAVIISWFKLDETKDTVLYSLFISAYLFLGLAYSLVCFPQFYSGLLAIFTAGKLLGVIILFFLVGRLIQKEALIKKLSEQSSIGS